jgi:hypothetical protein
MNFDFHKMSMLIPRELTNDPTQEISGFQANRGLKLPRNFWTPENDHFHNMITSIVYGKLRFKTVTSFQAEFLANFFSVFTSIVHDFEWLYICSI